MAAFQIKPKIVLTIWPDLADVPARGVAQIPHHACKSVEYILSIMLRGRRR
jgi:hypothetical protein